MYATRRHAGFDLGRWRFGRCSRAPPISPPPPGHPSEHGERDLDGPFVAHAPGFWLRMTLLFASSMSLRAAAVMACTVIAPTPIAARFGHLLSARACPTELHRLGPRLARECSVAALGNRTHGTGLSLCREKSAQWPSTCPPLSAPMSNTALLNAGLGLLTRRITLVVTHHRPIILLLAACVPLLAGAAVPALAPRIELGNLAARHLSAKLGRPVTVGSARADEPMSVASAREALLAHIV